MPHRATLKKANKPFKSRRSTKGSLKVKSKGKIESKVSKDKVKSDQDGPKVKSGLKQAKRDRKNLAAQIKTNKVAKILDNKKLFDGRDGASKIVAFVPLTADCDPREAIALFNQSAGVETPTAEDMPVPGMVKVSVDRFKQKLMYILPPRNFIAILDAAKVSDFVIFGLSATQEVDEFGELCIRSIESQGVSNVIPIIHNLSEVGNVKKQADVRGSLLSYFMHFFPTTDKIYSPHTASEALNVTRILCQKFPQGINWRDSRFYLLGEQVAFDQESNSVVVEGTVRGRGINVDRLVHIPGFGDYQLAKIEKVSQHREMTDDDENVIVPVSPESLDELAPEPVHEYEDEEMEEGEGPIDEESVGVRLDGHHYFKDEELHTHLDSDGEEQSAPKRQLPKGMSEYQSRWIVDDEDLVHSDEEVASDDEGEGEEEDNDAMSDGETEGRRVTFSEAATDYDDARSEMFQELTDEEERAQLKEFRQRARDELEFPDEIELDPNASAKERLSRYRGLKSLRSCHWDVDERDARAPEEWSRLTRIINYNATKNRVLKQQITEAQVHAGTRVRLYVQAPPSVVESVSPGRPMVVYGLLEHEHKLGYVNATMVSSSEYDEPVRAKDSLIMVCGPRRLTIRPVFSQPGNGASNNVYKFERFLQPGGTVTASMIAPLVFGNVPVVYFKADEDKLALVGTGSIMNADHNRILARRAVLTGHPLKIHKKLVTIRYMFFNREDVLWFKAVPLFTKTGRTGYIKESLGTHGYFKATFDGRLTSQDTIGMALYKRVWPRPSIQWTGGW